MDAKRYFWLEGKPLSLVLLGSYEHHHDDHLKPMLAWFEHQQFVSWFHVELIVSDKPFYRKTRLGDVLRSAQSRVKHKLSDRIMALEDQKGQLTVHWELAPTEEEQDAFLWAWESVGEQASNITHLQGQANSP